MNSPLLGHLAAGDAEEREHVAIEAAVADADSAEVLHLRAGDAQSRRDEIAFGDVTQDREKHVGDGGAEVVHRLEFALGAGRNIVRDFAVMDEVIGVALAIDALVTAVVAVAGRCVR